jgi:hypothetical protein
MQIDFTQVRDEELRLAHRRAFAKISQARLADDYRATVRMAVEELIDACETYTLAR